MLTVISDLHLTDGTSGTTINEKAFKIFNNQISALAKDRKAKSFELVLLGDIFDIIRSERWFGVDVRPWGSKSVEQENITMDILNAILEKNSKAIFYLRETIKKIKSTVCQNAKITYLMGNHDWLINRYPSVRKKVRAALGIGGANKFSPKPLQSSKHKCVLHHGDIFDNFNYENNNRDASSFGDALVIELLGKFPLACAKRLDMPRDAPLINYLREIDNLRPYGAIPIWVNALVKRMNKGKKKQKEMSKIISTVFIDLLKDFKNSNFMRDRDTNSLFDIQDKLSYAWLFAKIFGAPLKRLEKFGKHFEKISSSKNLKDDKYFKGVLAFREKFPNSNYIVFGHSHKPKIYPLDKVGINKEFLYFNSGTWRKQYKQTIINPKEREFIGSHVLTHVSFYSKDDGTKRNYEVWNGVLGELDNH